MGVRIVVNDKNPPLGALIVGEFLSSSKKGQVEIEYSKTWNSSSNIQLLVNDKVICDDNYGVGRYLARTIDNNLYGGADNFSRTQVDSWLSFSLRPLQSQKSPPEALNHLNTTLSTRTWLVSKQLTLADIYVFSALQNYDSTQSSDSNQQYEHINRWYNHLSSLPFVQKLSKFKSTPKMSEKPSKKPTGTARKQEGKFIELPGAEQGKVVVRFPPEASGFLHIGHAKAALLNQYYAEAFAGQLIMRFDDTNPAKENVEYEQAILEDLKLLQIKPDRFTHSSDYFDLMLTLCEQLIKENKAYVDDTPAELMKEQREQRIPSANRDNSCEKNLSLWQEMKLGTQKGQECCVRAKIDYQNPNGCLRDPTIYRCKPESHPRTGKKYNVYPTYDFACPIVDSVEGVTHTLRTTEYHDRDEQFFWFIDALKLRKPYIWAYSRLNMTNTVLSKRKLTWFVDNNIVDGWDDPRFPTVRGILRRGMTVEGLKQFIIAQGSSRSVVFMEWDKIWAFNKKVIDPIAVRYTALDAESLVPVSVDGKEGIEILTVQNHPKDPSKGTKKVLTSKRLLIEREDADTLKVGENATFINWGNLRILEIVKENNKIVEVKARLNLDDKDYKGTVKLTWLAENDDNEKVPQEMKEKVRCVAVYFGHIISKAVLGKDDDFKDFVAKDTKREVELLGEPELKRVKKGEIIQLQRKGFFRCDVPYAPMSDFSSRECPLILFHIPDGHNTLSASTTTEVAKKAQSKSSSSDLESIAKKIEEQGNKVRDLKAAKSDKQTIDIEVKKLLALKSDYKNQSGSDWKPGTTKTPSINLSDLSASIEQQGNKVRDLKAAKADKQTIDIEVKKLLALKSDYKNQSGSDWKPGTTKTPSINLSDLSASIEQQGNKVRDLKAAKSDKQTIEIEVKKLLALKSDYKNQSGSDWKPSATKVSSVNLSDLSAVIEEQGNKIRDSKTPEMPTNSQESLNNKILAQGQRVRDLKSSKADKKIIDEEVKVLLSLKAEFKALTNQDWQQPSSNAPRKPKKTKEPTGGGTVIIAPVDVCVRQSAENTKTGTRLGLEAKKSENLSDWYSQVITKGEMIEYYDVSGCYILRPWSYSIWEVIKDYFDGQIKKLGVQNCYFPIFVSKAVLEREKTHIADFAPEVAWVTKSGESDLAEPIAIRPTSETVMYPAYAKWLKSHRDLPLKLNQWNNVVRWEFKHPQPFLRTREFLWQEGHSAFLTKNEADDEVLTILELYAKIYEDLLAIPVVRGRKTEKEKFAGGDYTTTVEAFVSASGRAIQGATSHHLGQNFSRMFDIQVEGADEAGEKTFVYQNSWGLTTRTIGVMVMVHGDDKGLVLPPNVASVQVIMVPCGITATTTKEQREKLFQQCQKLEAELKEDGDLRVKADYRDNYSPGWKFNHWELKGVPVRVELGFKDLEKEQVTLVRRDNSERVIAKRTGIKAAIQELLEKIQKNMYAKANNELQSHIKPCINWKDFCKILDNKNLILAPFCGEIECEDKIKADSTRDDAGDEPGSPSMGAKSLCIPFDQPKNVSLTTLKCIHPDCTRKPKFHTLFGRSY